MHMTGPLGIGMMRDGSGTTWLPDDTPMHAIHRQRGAWDLMLHWNLFAQYLDDPAPRGGDQFGSINWVMGMAHRPVKGGPLTLRLMMSAEPVTVAKCGYPDLLASGERCNDQPLHDRQHPHDMFMEVAAQYQREISPALAYQLYAAVAGEPALGPVAYPHRPSAMPNPIAPIVHHWLDATHISFGVVSAGVYQRRWKLEGSVFNGREPDEERFDIDLGPLDSYAGRVWWLPTDRLAFQISAGHLREAEQSDPGAPRVDVDRMTASATYHRQFANDRFLATTIAWGRNREDGETATNAILAEASYALDHRNTLFGRFETVDKSAHDLDVPVSLVHDAGGDETFTVAKLQGGYTRHLFTRRNMMVGVGVTASAGFVPAALEPVYGKRVNPGFGVFINVRPTEMAMAHPMGDTGSMPMTHPPGDTTSMPMQHPVTAPHEHPEPAAGAKPAAKPSTPTALPRTPAGDPALPVLPVERVVDPACAGTIDVLTAPRATWQGKVYYFWFGSRGLSARAEPGRVETAVARTMRGLAIPRRDRDRANPVASAPAVIAAGMAHFADHCAACHANDGSGETEIGLGLYPRPPDLRLPPTQSLTDGEIFYTIQNGVRLTGMPAWGSGHAQDADSTWHLVHFIRELPRLTPQQIEEMRRLNPTSSQSVASPDNQREGQPAKAPHEH